MTERRIKVVPQEFICRKKVFAGAIAVALCATSGCSLAGKDESAARHSGSSPFASYIESLDEDAPADIFLHPDVGVIDEPALDAPLSLPKPHLVMTPEVRRELNRFVFKDRGYIESAYPTYMAYAPQIERIFAHHGVPKELINLAIVESRFQSNARSHKGAVGLWQFMRATAVSYGLNTHGRDERLDPLRSSVAAARYLRFLYGEFRDWHLALAAYNTGQARLSRALDRVGTDDFWKLARSGEIARETAQFVPRFIAITMIMENPEAYGFSRTF